GKIQRSRVAPLPLSTHKTEPKPYTLVNSGGSPRTKRQEFKFPYPPPTEKPSEGPYRPCHSALKQQCELPYVIERKYRASLI
ncbi:hypothetical protein C0J52_16905, partial [Blattella germanica]